MHEGDKTGSKDDSQRQQWTRDPEIVPFEARLYVRNRFNRNAQTVSTSLRLVLRTVRISTTPVARPVSPPVRFINYARIRTRTRTRINARR